MDPKLIQPIEAIPDYLESTTYLDPIVIKTHSSCYCLEGWKMAQEALTAEKNIRCLTSRISPKLNWPYARADLETWIEKHRVRTEGDLPSSGKVVKPVKLVKVQNFNNGIS